VVITGAQRPLAATRNDARGNLLTAVELAASPRLHPSLQQVTLFFGEVLLQGNRARKRSAAEFDAFESPQASPLAVVGTEIRFLESKPEARKRSVRRSRARARSSLKQERFDQRIGMLHLTPGFPSKAVREALLPKLRALVLVAFASGTAPTQDPEFLALLQAARREGKPVIVTTEGASRVPSEAPEGLAAYAAGEKMLKEGVLWAGEMTPECAYVKAALGIAELPGKNPEADFQAFSRFWSMNFANEGSPSS
jgi:L-asparaginase/Glu-tRNA(Gln) amidotransferase subunit D